MKIDNFRGELTDISAEKETLVNRERASRVAISVSSRPEIRTPSILSLIVIYRINVSQQHVTKLLENNITAVYLNTKKRRQNRWTAVLPFSKLKKIFFGYFDPEHVFEIMKINNFRGELTDISAKRNTVVHWTESVPRGSRCPYHPGRRFERPAFHLSQAWLVVGDEADWCRTCSPCRACLQPTCPCGWVRSCHRTLWSSLSGNRWTGALYTGTPRLACRPAGGKTHLHQYFLLSRSVG